MLSESDKLETKGATIRVAFRASCSMESLISDSSSNFFALRSSALETLNPFSGRLNPSMNPDSTDVVPLLLRQYSVISAVLPQENLKILKYNSAFHLHKFKILKSNLSRSYLFHLVYHTRADN